jgi:nucleoside-diphosphate-sugar epimerase
MKVLIAGCGWLGTAVARTLIERGDRVTGIRRDPEAAAELKAMGVEPLCLDLLRPGSSRELPDEIEAIVACPAPGTPGVEQYERTYIDALRVLLEFYASSKLKGFVYTGSTGVFGQTDGGEVREHTPVLPTNDTARVLVRAEEQVLAWGREHSCSTCVVRLSGLYGPERFGVIDRVRDGRLGLGEGDDAWMNFCHRADAARSVVAALDRGRPGEVYHASDETPVRRRELILWLAEHYGFEPVRSPAGTTLAAGTNRRISADWSRSRLGIELAYPSFREGLVRALSESN